MVRYVFWAWLFIIFCAAVWSLYKNRWLFKEFWIFLKVEKMWWLVPAVLALLLMAALLLTGAGASLSPFIYAIF